MPGGQCPLALRPGPGYDMFFHMLTTLTEAQCRHAMSSGEFPPEVTAAAPIVVIVLTQSWCPQWTMLRAMLQGLPEDSGRAFFQVEYDLVPWFEDFMAFKERVLGNDLVPYLRYYRNGSLFKTSNWLDRSSFLRIIES
jgi:hypothetical protein